jgi:CubicO group peptidase (beta-lactamase class C family)
MATALRQSAIVRSVAVAGLLVVIPSAAPAQRRAIPIAEIRHSSSDSADTRLIAALRTFIPQVIRQHGTPGINLAVARRGRVIWEAGFGFADLERRTPMTPETVFHSGSMGKAYTATAVMQLVERGVMALDEPINNYLRGFEIKNPLGDREITLRDLLTHRTGLTGNAAGSGYREPKPLAQHVRETYARGTFPEYRNPLWSAKVGERPQYSNLGLATLGLLVEVTNPDRLSFSDYVQRHIIDPLGMRSTQYPPVQDRRHIRPEIFARMSTGYAKFGSVHVPTPTIYFADHPAGTVVSVPGQHIKLVLAYLGGGSYNGYRLLGPETVKQMITPQVRVSAELQWGLVWWLRNVGQDEFSFSHGGDHMWGWSNELAAYPELDLAVAVSKNQWPIPNDSPDRKRELQLIQNFIVGWIKRERAGLPAPPPRSWAWKTSYVIGLMMAQSLAGVLGIDPELVAKSGEAMAKGGRGDVMGVAEPLWDPAGFRAGLADLAPLAPTRDSVRAFLKSDRLRVAPEELELLFRELGGRGALP